MCQPSEPWTMISLWVIKFYKPAVETEWEEVYPGRFYNVYQHTSSLPRCLNLPDWIYFTLKSRVSKFWGPGTRICAFLFYFRKAPCSWWLKSENKLSQATWWVFPELELSHLIQQLVFHFKSAISPKQTKAREKIWIYTREYQ